MVITGVFYQFINLEPSVKDADEPYLATQWTRV